GVRRRVDLPRDAHRLERDRQRVRRGELLLVVDADGAELLEAHAIELRPHRLLQRLERGIEDDRSVAHLPASPAGAGAGTSSTSSTFEGTSASRVASAASTGSRVPRMYFIAGLPFTSAPTC